MSEKTLKFSNIIINKKKFHKSKKPRLIVSRFRSNSCIL